MPKVTDINGPDDASASHSTGGCAGSVDAIVTIGLRTYIDVASIGVAHISTTRIAQQRESEREDPNQCPQLKERARERTPISVLN